MFLCSYCSYNNILEDLYGVPAFPDIFHFLYLYWIKPVTFFQAEATGDVDPNKATSIYDFTMLDIDGNSVPLEKYKWVKYR